MPAKVKHKRLTLGRFQHQFVAAAPPAADGKTAALPASAARKPHEAEEAGPHPANHVARLWTLVDKINRELRSLPPHIEACITPEPGGELRCLVDYGTPEAAPPLPAPASKAAPSNGVTRH